MALHVDHTKPFAGSINILLLHNYNKYRVHCFQNSESTLTKSSGGASTQLLISSTYTQNHSRSWYISLNSQERRRRIHTCRIKHTPMELTWLMQCKKVASETNLFWGKHTKQVLARNTATIWKHTTENIQPLSSPYRSNTRLTCRTHIIQALISTWNMKCN